jgi:AcrR family transcriptional regulator
MTAGVQPTASKKRRRLTPEDREEQIVQKAIVVFSQEGFTASTRDLAKALGITQSLLYRYFATKEDLVDRVYDEVFFRPWNDAWEEWLSDRASPLSQRLKRYFKDYAGFVTRSNLVRLHMFAGLMKNTLIHRYIDTLKETHFKVIARELRHEFGIPDPANPAEEADELELVWATHSSFFYMGVRQWIYEFAPTQDIDRAIDILVDGFLMGAPAALKARRSA